MAVKKKKNRRSVIGT